MTTIVLQDCLGNLTLEADDPQEYFITTGGNLARL